MQTIDTLVIGAGHAGLAMSRCLTDRGIEHAVLERGRVAQRWRSARWDSFRMLTPRWLARLPGWAYTGAEPDGFMDAPEFVTYLEDYARTFTAPVVERTAVLGVGPAPGGYRVRTDRGDWHATNVVIASGYHARAHVPPHSGRLAEFTAAGYRGPDQPPDGGVLVVGASASGVQIADELARAGRRVVLAVGTHTRLPRTYRGRDIFWWLERVGSLDRTAGEVPAREPSLQLAGTGRPVDLGSLHRAGVRLAGRLIGLDDRRARFAGDLAATMAKADARMRRVLTTVDKWADGPQETVAPIAPPEAPGELELRGIGSVIWATGFRPSYPWLHVPVLDATGHIRHERGVTAAPGLFAIGLRFQHRRSSTLIDGARHDAAHLVDHLTRADRRRAGRVPDPQGRDLGADVRHV